jgi:hypothetical protein
MITRCPKCTGKKVIMGMGGILKNCPECKGIGHVKFDNEVGLVQIQDAPKMGKLTKEQIQRAVDSVSKPRRPGRPKKVNDERFEG